MIYGIMFKYRELFESKNKKKRGIYPHIVVSDLFRDFIDYNDFNRHVYNLKTMLLTVETDISFIDIGNKIDTVSYLPYDKYDKDKDLTNSKHRQEMKIGKFINKIYNDCEMVSYQLDEIVNLYKSYVNAIRSTHNLKIVQGEDIRKWYLGSNYKKGDGSLNKSCMRYSDYQHRLGIYVDNPDRISLIILLDDNKELLGRSLLWKLDDNRIYMDRIYTVEEFYRITFETFARENSYITYNDLDEQIVVTLKNIDYDHYSNYPYMDTFSFCNIKLHKLSNDTIGKKCIYLDYN